MQYKTTLFCVCVVVVLFSLLHPSVADNGGGGRAPILVDDQPPLLPGIPLPDEGHDHHCEGGHGHAPHEHNEAHKHYLNEPRFLDGQPTDWANQGIKRDEGGGGFAPKEKDEL